MKHEPMNDHHDEIAAARFDRTLRAHHAAALEALSPRVQAQLAQRRHAALRGETAGRPARGLRFAVAGFAALCALAIGLQFRSPPAPGTAPAAIASATAIAPASAGTTTLLDEDPEFYAWLASADAQLVAME